MELERYFQAEAEAINRVLRSMGVDAGVERTLDLPGYVGYVVALGVRTRPEELGRVKRKLDEELLRLRGLHGLPMSVPTRICDMPPMLEVEHPQPRELAWAGRPAPSRSGAQGAAQRALALVGRSYAPRLANEYVNFEVSPHVLIAGTSGSGKSTLANGLISSYAAQVRPSQAHFLFVDLKNEDFLPYKDLPHTLAWAGVREEAGAVLALAEGELQARIREPGRARTPWFLVIDELATLMRERGERERLVAFMETARSKGMHVIACVQEPTKETIGSHANWSVRFVGAVTTVDGARFAAGRGGSGAHELPTGAGAFLRIQGRTMRRVQTYNCRAEDVAAGVAAAVAAHGRGRLVELEPNAQWTMDNAQESGGGGGGVDFARLAELVALARPEYERQVAEQGRLVNQAELIRAMFGVGASTGGANRKWLERVVQVLAGEGSAARALSLPWVVAVRSEE